MNEKEHNLQAILDKSVDEKRVFGTTFSLKKGDFVWYGSAGNLTPDDPYFIASTTKLFTTTRILQLRSEQKIHLDDKITTHLDARILKGLHVFKGHEYSEEITIRHLLAHTSGLPDYFQDKGASGKSLEDEIAQGMDQFWSFDEALQRTKNLKPLFKPGTSNKAHYSDANFQLLGKIIENITQKSFGENCDTAIIQPLGLRQTYLYQDPADTRPANLYYKSNSLHIPQAMTSFGADGGIVSTSKDMLQFIEAFFSGKLFPLSYVAELQEWNRIFFPMRSGVGIHLFKLPWLFNPTGAVPWFIGHSGLSGALAYYSPQEDMYIAGTVNQVAHPDLSFKTMIKLARLVIKG